MKNLTNKDLMLRFPMRPFSDELYYEIESRLSRGRRAEEAMEKIFHAQYNEGLDDCEFREIADEILAEYQEGIK
jgi:hypothetical protein